MSKAALRKELNSFTREQLIDVVMAAYDSSPKAKEYFEFFLCPDVDKFLDKQVEIVAKELNKTKWGRCKARITVIRNAIKEFEAFGADTEHVAKLIYLSFRMTLGASGYYDIPEPLKKGIGNLGARYMRIAAENGFLPKALDDLKTSLKTLGTKSIRRMVEARLADEASELNIELLVK